MESGGGWSAATIAKIAACAAAAGYVAYKIKFEDRSTRPRRELAAGGDGPAPVIATDLIEEPERTKTVPVELLLAGRRGRRASVDLDLTKITGWGGPLIATLAAGVGVDPASVASVWIREDDEEEPDRLDDKPKGGWKRVLKMDEAAVLLLDTGTPTAGPSQEPAAPAAAPALAAASAAAKPAAERPTCVTELPPPPAAGKVLRGPGDAEVVEVSPEHRQDYERPARLLLTDPHNYTMLRALQEVRPPANNMLLFLHPRCFPPQRKKKGGGAHAHRDSWPLNSSSLSDLWAGFCARLEHRPPQLSLG